MKPIILILMDHLRLTEPTLPNKALMSDLSEGEDDSSFRITVLLGSFLFWPSLLYNRLYSKECSQQLIGAAFYSSFNLFSQNTESADPLESFMSVVCRVKILSLHNDASFS